MSSMGFVETIYKFFSHLSKYFILFLSLSTWAARPDESQSSMTES